jgi:Fe-S-cluster containining protein
MSALKKQPGHRRVLPVLHEVDSYMEKNLKLVGTTSCTKGCASCCELLVVTTSGEAEVLAEAIVAAGRDVALAVLAKVDAQTALIEGWDREFGDDEAGERKSRHAWWHARQTCALLDDKTRTCRFYGARPSPCRSYYVVSEPHLCGERGRDGQEVKTLQLVLPQPVQREFLRRIVMATEDAGFEAMLGTLPQLLSIALRRRLGMPARLETVSGSLAMSTTAGAP